MFVPAVKFYEISSSTKIKFPRKVYFADATAAKQEAVLSEFMPYARFTASESQAQAQIVFQTVPGISDKAEYYEIKSDNGIVTVNAKDSRGIINAMATLSQMISYSEGEYSIKNGIIRDYPDKPFRSFMVDTGRKYIPINQFRAQILSMAKAKMNKLHIHISDSMGVPVELESYPKLKFAGRYKKKYTKDELKDLVAYASMFGIDVIPEIDMPGHASEIVSSYPELRCVSKKRTNGWCFCISNEESYVFIENLLKEITEIFPGEYIHIGTDEIDMKDVKLKGTRGLTANQDWDICHRCKAKFKELKLKTTTEKFYYFLRRVYSIVTGLGKKMIVWNDNIDISVSPELPRDILIEFWRVAAENRGPVEGCSMKRFIEEGFEVINADYPNTYMDLSCYMKWDKLKSWDLTKDPADAGERSYAVIGGETCAWDVQKHYGHSVYTAIPAFAERCWNLAAVANEEEFLTSLTRLVLGVTTPNGFNAFDKYLRSPIMTSNDCVILKESANPNEFKAILKSLTKQTSAEKALTNAYIKLTK